MPDFFDYHCDACDTPFCERIHIMNLALDHLDEEYCLGCLTQQEGMAPQAFADWITEYIMSRDCFKTPWENFDASPCPLLASHTCYCQPAVAA